jgi:hypothetical protein
VDRSTVVYLIVPLRYVESAGTTPWLVYEDISKTNKGGLQHKKCEQKHYANVNLNFALSGSTSSIEVNALKVDHMKRFISNHHWSILRLVFGILNN